MILQVEQRLTSFRQKDRYYPYDVSNCTTEVSSKNKVTDETCGRPRSGDLAILNNIFGRLLEILLIPFRHLSYFINRWQRLSIAFTVVSWFIAQCYFVYIEFGLVFFTMSLFVCLFMNLGNRKTGELSAYSVFNLHCERLPGTLTAEHFERDLLIRPRLS